MCATENYLACINKVPYSTCLRCIAAGVFGLRSSGVWVHLQSATDSWIKQWRLLSTEQNLARPVLPKLRPAAFTAVPIFHFLCPTSVTKLWTLCIYTHTYLTACRLYMNYRRYQITNICTQIWAVRSVDWIFIVGAPVWRWLGQYVTLGRTFCCLLLKREATAVAVTATVCLLEI